MAEMAAPPRDLGKLLLLLKELTIDAGTSVTITAARSLLASLKGSSNVAKSAKALLACEPASDGNRAKTVMFHVLHR